MAIVLFIMTSLFAGFVFLVWLFFFLHAVQHVQDPVVRSIWAMCFVVFNLLCVLVYIYIEYRFYLKLGQGGLMRSRNAQIPENKG